MESVENQSSPSHWILLHKLLFAAFFGLLAWWLLVEFQVVSPKYLHLVQGALPVITAVLTIANLTRRLPVENAIMAGVYVAGISGIVQIIGLKTGIPFGSFVYTDDCGARLFGLLPWTIPFVWLVLVLNSRELARLILRPWRKTDYYGFWVMGIAAVLTVVLVMELEPFATQINEFWIWKHSPGMPAWYGAPWVNFLGWFVTTLIILFITTLWLINKKPVKQEPPDFAPLVVWLALNLFFVIMHARHHFILAACFGLVTGFVVTVMALSGARWEQKLH
jgi:uncharacterized membrane protein